MNPSDKLTIARIVICLEIMLLVTSTMADSDGSSKRFCGRDLSDSLALICDGEYEAIIPRRRRSAQYDDIPMQSSALVQKLAPGSLRSRVRRDWSPRHGVYDECCRKPCSISELKNYCKRKT